MVNTETCGSRHCELGRHRSTHCVAHRTHQPSRSAGVVNRDRAPSCHSHLRGLMGIHRRSRTSRHVCKSARYRVNSFDLRLLGGMGKPHALLLPVCPSHGSLRLDASRPRPRRGKQNARAIIVAHISQGCLATTSTSREQRCVTRLAVLLERLWRCGHDAVRHIHPRDLPPISRSIRTRRKRRSRTHARRAHGYCAHRRTTTPATRRPPPPPRLRSPNSTTG